ncbi:MAG: ribosome maturation factor RimM [Actinomycetes bacterium]
MSSSTEPVKVARLGRPHGLQGFLGLYVDDADLAYFEPGSTVLVGDRELTVRALRRGDKGWQVAFEEVPDRTAAEAIRNLDVLTTSERELEEGEFWDEDLIGLEVRPLGGVVVGVEHGPVQSRLVVEKDGVTFEVPFVADLVPVVDLEGGFVEVVLLEGLLPVDEEG